LTIVTYSFTFLSSILISSLRRWEVQILNILPQEAMAQIKKARAARKKVGTQFNTLGKLLASLKEADRLLYDHETAASKSKSAIKAKLDKVLARISQEEEKVLKYEREAEKARLSTQAKDLKQATKEKKEREEQEKQKLKEEMAQKKERKKEESAREKELKKQEVMQKKEAAAEDKRKKQEQIEKAKAQKKVELNKQRKCMQSFFTTAKPASTKKAAEAAPDATAATPVLGESEPSATPVKVDNDAKALADDSSITGVSEVDHFTLSTATDTGTRRKRKIKMVTISIHVTPDLSKGVWGQQAFAELRPVKVRNGFKFLRFHEDIRPAYHGTWSKKSSIVTGRTPFAKDTKFLNYDYDSEAEWEEGDDEVGEDIENDAGDDEEENEDEEVDDEDDGWLAADDEFGDDPDEETIRLRKKMRSIGGMSRPRTGENVVCIIAPSMGKPMGKTDGDSYCGAASVAGFAFQEGVELLYMHCAETVNVYSLYLDAFPPPFCEEMGDVVAASASPSDGNKQASSTGSKEMSIPDQQTFMRFVHNSSWGSKDKLVDEFRTAHPSIASSRALVVRTLESCADKKKHPIKIAVWQVKREILEKLELNDFADEAAIDDPEEAQKQILKEIAMAVHHTTLSSKEKLADALLATQFSFAISRAELMRHLEAMAEKKKVAAGGVIYWEVKASVRDELGLAEQLSSSPPPALAVSLSDSAEKPPSGEDEAASKEEQTDGKKSFGTTGKKRKAVDHSSSTGSSKLLASFLAKKK
jgi:chromatin assembly factor 1 subunit A